MKERIAISFRGNDCIRIIPMPPKNQNAEIKFHFFDDSYVIRKFDFNQNVGGLIYNPVDHGQAEHEISYHSANEYHPTPVLLPKYKDSQKKRILISDEIINLSLSDIIVPIPICRVTTNISSSKKYKKKDQHWPLELTDAYNTADIYIAGKDYDFDGMSKKYPLILHFLFPITTIDFLIYGSGMATEPIFNKMFQNKGPIVAFQSTTVGDYQFFCRTYQLFKTDAFRMYSKREYSSKNFIEFFNNVDYLDLLATTSIAYKLSPSKTTPIKAAYEYDLENMMRMGYRRKYILKLEKRFKKKKQLYKRLKKFRSGIIIPFQ